LIINGLLIKDPQPHRDGLPPNDDDGKAWPSDDDNDNDDGLSCGFDGRF